MVGKGQFGPLSKYVSHNLNQDLNVVLIKPNDELKYPPDSPYLAESIDTKEATSGSYEDAEISRHTREQPE